MKKVISGNYLQEKMIKAISLLCDTVKTTLGPKGSNVIIDHSTFNPFITNDGVTIASNIASDDEIENTILELAKEAAVKTNEKVGDGTTTTLVLLESIYRLGLEYIKMGENPLIIKKELDEALEKILEKLSSYKKRPTKEELRKVASVAGNDSQIGKIVSDVYLKIKNRQAIFIKEEDIEDVQIEYLNGYHFTSLLASPYFLKGLKKVSLENPYVFIYNNNLDDFEDVIPLVNFMIENNNSLVILANDYSDYFLQNILNFNMERENKIILLRMPEYGFRQIGILEDLEAILDKRVVRKQIDIKEDNLGSVSKIVIDNEKVLISFVSNEKVKLQIAKLEKDKNNTTSEKEFIEERIAMFKKGSANILVGGKTLTERRELKMRYDDAMEAISNAYLGVLPGSGLMLSKISEEIKIENKGDNILKQALLKPMEQIYINAALPYEDIFLKIKNECYQILYNVMNDKYEDIEHTEVLDSYNVVKNSLISAVSIAGMLLSTTSLVVNEYQNKKPKIEELTEL